MKKQRNTNAYLMQQEDEGATLFLRPSLFSILLCIFGEKNVCPHSVKQSQKENKSLSLSQKEGEEKNRNDGKGAILARLYSCRS